MTRSPGTLLRDQGRGVVGALIVSIELLFTMEMWWTGWQLPTAWLATYAVVGLCVVLAVTRFVGFRRDGRERQFSLRTVAADFAALLLQSFLTAYAVLLLFGIVDLGDPLFLVTRLGLVFVVPLGFGAALANELLRSIEEESKEAAWPLQRRLGVFAVGALFVSMTMAPTDEMQLMAAYAGWGRLALVIVLGVLVVYLVLFELEFRGHASRTASYSPARQWSYSVVVYAVGVVVAASLLAGLGQFGGTTVAVWVQMTVVLALPAAIGASGAQVVLG